jgi:hypothetical protein
MKMTKAITATFFACVLILGTSCGKKNTVNSSASGSGGISSTSPIFANSSTGGTIYSQYQALRSSISCLSGKNRLAADISYYTTATGSGTTVPGNVAWTQGVLPSGSASNLYVGVSAFGDILFLIKVTNGSQVVGYNVITSYCEVSNPYPPYPLLVSNDRQLTNFQTSNITVNTATSCGYGLIAYAYTYMLSQPSTTNPYASSPFQVYTSFAAPTCNH